MLLPMNPIVHLTGRINSRQQEAPSRPAATPPAPTARVVNSESGGEPTLVGLVPLVAAASAAGRRRFIGPPHQCCTGSAFGASAGSLPTATAGLLDAGIAHRG